MAAYYNEVDPFAAAWLRNLIAAGLIAPGEVDERSILDVRPDDLRGFDQCHFFAGIGVWSLALRRAGWPDDRPIWTGSCPCQPLSSAGQRKGHADERHLWPAFHALIAECRPAVAIGEQVASKDGREWFSAVRADLEALGYACGAADISAAGTGAPHIRQRLYWLANASGAGRRQARRDVAGDLSANGTGPGDWPGDAGAAGGLADALRAERWSLCLDEEDGRDGSDGGREEAHGELGARGEVRGLADAGSISLRNEGRDAAGGSAGEIPGEVREQRLRVDPASGGGAEPDRLANANARRQAELQRGIVRSVCEGRIGVGAWSGPECGGPTDRPSPTNGLWANPDWLLCRDGKWRPTQPDIQPLAPAGSVRNRVGILRGSGNALCLGQAQAFIEAMMETLP